MWKGWSHTLIEGSGRFKKMTVFASLEAVRMIPRLVPDFSPVRIESLIALLENNDMLQG